MISQAIDSVIFVTIAFAGVVPRREFLQIALSTYLLKWLAAVADTPLVYLAALWYRRARIREV